jgi:glucokinase
LVSTEIIVTQLLLALDFGGTKHAAAVAVKGTRDWKAYRRVLTPLNSNARIDLETMKAIAREVLGGQIPSAIGISFGGPVDAQTGTVRLSHHVRGWENVPLQHILEAEFSAPACVDNDANAAAWGEYQFGAGQGYSSLFYITISTGVGGGWILNSKPWRGTGGMAGEIGHTVVDPHGPICLCGKRGCIERLASGRYMAQDVNQQLQDSPDRGPILRRLRERLGEPITGQLIAQAAAEGDPLAKAALLRSARAVGVGIGNTANLIGPQRFILGGGVTNAGELFWEKVQQVARETALPEVEFEIVPAALGDDAPLWGAIAMAEALH